MRLFAESVSDDPLRTRHTRGTGARTLGLDIGGVNIKAAHSKGGVWTVPFVLTNQPDRFSDVLHDLIRQVPDFDRIAVTMTAELCDCYVTKREGVCGILDAIEVLAAGRDVRIWTTDGCLIDPAQARRGPLRCAASNWHALASYTAGLFPEGTSLLIDTGSTTTDIVRLQHGSPDTKSLTDMDRLSSGELVYLGAAKTPIAFLGPEIEWRGRVYGLMAEPFATTADIFLLTGDLPEDPRCTDTANGRPMRRIDAATRLVRMIGADLEMLTRFDAEDLAKIFADRVYHHIAAAIVKVLNGQRPDRVVIAGSGGFVASASASIAPPGVSQISLASMIGRDASHAACAYAIAQLASDEVHARRASP